MTITELIQQEAAKQRIYQPKYGEVNDERQECFELGAKFMLEHIIGFAKWVEVNAIRDGLDTWVYRWDKCKEPLSIEQLFNIYLESLQTKQS